MNINKVLTKDYEKKDTWSIGKTKPIQSQSKPIQSQFKPKTNPNKANLIQFQRQKICPAAPIYLTIINMVANLKSRLPFWLFKERTLFRR
jgi:hypothetical protein